MSAVANAKSNLPNLKNDGRMHVHLSGNHFQQNEVNIPNNCNIINIYCVYKLNIGRTIKRMSFNELRDFIFENYYKRIGFVKKKLFFNETFKKKQLLLLATKLIEKIPDPCNTKKIINHLH